MFFEIVPYNYYVRCLLQIKGKYNNLGTSCTLKKKFWIYGYLHLPSVGSTSAKNKYSSQRRKDLFLEKKNVPPQKKHAIFLASNFRQKVADFQITVSAIRFQRIRNCCSSCICMHMYIIVPFFLWNLQRKEEKVE